MAAPGIELAKAYVSIIPSFRGGRSAISKEFGGIGGEGTKVGATFGDRMKAGFLRAAGGFAHLVGRTIRAGVLAGGAAVTAAAFIGIKTAAELETARISFETMLGSGEKAEAFLNRLKDFAARTPFDLPGLQVAAQSLIAIGIDAEKVIPIMTTLGNVTSGMGTGAEGVRRATIAIQQMNAAGRITAEDLNQLRDAGVPVFDLLTAATGKTTAEIAHMAQNGKLGRKELDQLMVALETGKGFERFDGMMQKQSKSLRGLWETLKDTFSVGMANAIEPAIPLIKDMLGGAIIWVGDVAVPSIQAGIRWMFENIPPTFQAIGDAARGSVQWVKENQAWLIPTAAAIIGYAAAVQTLAIIQTVRKWIVAWQAAQWGLNAAIAFFAGVSGIGLIVAGISALVAGLVWAYHNVGWFRDGVQAAWRGIQSAVGRVTAWWQSYVQPVIAAVLDGIGKGARWLYENAIRPAWNGIMAASRAVGGVFMWLWTNIGKPVFGFLVGAVRAWWLLTSGIFQLGIGFIRKVLAPVFVWLWTNIARPVFNWIGSKISSWWTGARTIFMAGIQFLKTVFGPAFTWLQRNIIGPVFGAIGNIIDRAWNKTIRPIFSTLISWLKVTLPAAFRTGQQLIGKAWNAVTETVKAPIRFVVSNVINRGIIGTFNDIARKLEIKTRLDPVAVPGWLLPGGVYTRPDGRARGGIIPGYEPQKRDTVLMGMRPGEGVLVPEVVRALGVSFVNTLNAAGNAGGVNAVKALAMQGLARGGVVAGPYTITSGYGPRAGYNTPGGFHDGIDYAAATGTPVMAADRGRVLYSGWAPPAFAGGGNMVHLAHANGYETLYYHLSAAIARMNAMVSSGQMIGRVGSTGNSTGPHLHFTVRKNGQHINPAGWGGAGKGIISAIGDFIANPFGGMLDFAKEKFAAMFKGAGPFVDLGIGVGGKVIDALKDWLDNRLSGITDNRRGKGGPTPGLFDNGGMLGPGWNYNGLGTPEPVLTPHQWDIAERAIDAAAGGGGGDTWNLYGIPMDNAEETAKEIIFAKRRHTRGGVYPGGRP